MTDLTPPILSDDALHQLLAEDVPFGDLTTESLGIGAQPGGIRFFARDPMVVCGVEEAVRMFALRGAEAEALARLRRQYPEKRVVVEVGSPEEALRWAETDVLQLEKFSPEQVAETVAALAERGSQAVVGAAGGINVKNADAYARAAARHGREVGAR